MDLQLLRIDLEQRGRRLVTFYHWDPYILGVHSSLTSEVLPAEQLALAEKERWARGRFPSIPVCIADTLFSKQRRYPVAVRNAIRPFAQSFGSLTLEQFCQLSLKEVFHGTFGRAPSGPSATHFHHLSNEGRTQGVMLAATAFVRHGFTTTAEEVRLALKTPEGMAVVHRVLESTPGIGPALVAYALMNFGHLTIKADTHVIRVLGRYLGLSQTASPRQYEARLHAVAGELGLDPFVVDQIVWYTEAAALLEGRCDRSASIA